MVTLLSGGYRHLAFEDVGSTNSLCVEAAENGDQGNLWITGVRQLQGRGSRGRQWVSEAGNLYASLLLRNPGPLEKLHTLTFVASLAIRDAINRIAQTGKASVELKWPNDVLLNGKKTSGILLESHQINGERYIVIGIGINIEHFPQETLYPATSLLAEGIVSSPADFILLLNEAMAERLAQWDKAEGFASIRTDFLSAASNLGKNIEVKIPSKGVVETRMGKFSGIDEQGLLLLEGSNGKMERISVADIFFA
jgi:BirA family biotin operon repressor/biotin-[acetyl-CoA-carboxylase] ligase